jgi:hypothetical protein
LGRQGRRPGRAVPSRVHVWAHRRRGVAGRDFTPSSPAGLCPRVSGVTRRTARRLAAQACLRRRGRVRPVGTSPRRAARERRWCRVPTGRWTRGPGRVCPLSLGAVASVVSAAPPRLGPLPATWPCLWPPLAGRSPARGLLRPSLALSASGCPRLPPGERRAGVTPFLGAGCRGVSGRTGRRDPWGRPSGSRDAGSSRSPCPCWATPLPHVGLCHITTLLTCVRVPPRTPRGSAGCAGGFRVPAVHARFIAWGGSRRPGAWASPWPRGERHGPSTAPT